MEFIKPIVEEIEKKIDVANHTTDWLFDSPKWQHQESQRSI